MDWKNRHADKLMTAEDAAKIVRSGQSVYLGMFGSCPEGLAKALYARHPELEDVRIYHYVAPFLWSTPETQGHFRLVTAFATPADRKQVHAGMADYQPLGVFRESYITELFRHLDIAMVKTSPPDEHGYMSFGPSLWVNRTVCSIAKQIICEVDDRLIRTHGENFLHVSEVAALVEHAGIGVGAGSQHGVDRIGAAHRRIRALGALRTGVVEVERERNHLALLHQPRGGDDVLRRREIERANFIVGTPFAPVLVLLGRVAQVLARDFLR